LPSGVVSTYRVLAAIERLTWETSPRRPFFGALYGGWATRAIHWRSVDPARNSPQPSMQMSIVGRCYRNGLGGLALKSLLGGSVPSGRPRTMPGRAQGAGLSELAGSRQRVAENVPFARRRSVPENGARHFSCPRAPKKPGDVEAAKSMTCVEKPRPHAGKNGALGPRKSAIFRHFFLVHSGAPASLVPGMRTASGTKGKRGGPCCCAVMSALSHTRPISVSVGAGPKKAWFG
jgi:hypothetical protein